MRRPQVRKLRIYNYFHAAVLLAILAAIAATFAVAVDFIVGLF